MERLDKFLREAIVIGASLSTLVGCGIFDTREAEAPGTGGTPWVPPTTPAQVFVNLESGLEDLTGANYEKSLDDEFTFVPLQADVDKLGPDVYRDWTKAVEMDVTERILSDAQSVGVDFLEKRQIRDEADYAEFRVTCQIAVRYANGDEETFRERAQFDMKRVAGNWRLVKWTDQEGIEGFATWGYLRGITRNPNP